MAMQKRGTATMDILETLRTCNSAVMATSPLAHSAVKQRLLQKQALFTEFLETYASPFLATSTKLLLHLEVSARQTLMSPSATPCLHLESFLTMAPKLEP